MTSNQINARANEIRAKELEHEKAKLLETSRHNLETERAENTRNAETKRSNLAKEFGEYGYTASPEALAHRQTMEGYYPSTSSETIFGDVTSKISQFWDVLPFKVKIGGSK